MYSFPDPLWLFGGATMVGAFVFQALARYFARLSVLQLIRVTELVFSLVIGRLWLRRRGACGLGLGRRDLGRARRVPGDVPSGRVATPERPRRPGCLRCSQPAKQQQHVLWGRRRITTAPGPLYSAASGVVWAALASFKAFGFTANTSPAADRRSRSMPWP